ncbi:hypothetical protein JSY14_08020 [Brachybacterium sp. EF45031]|uniref:hypothetical protein n=1 Tax=Brachybacterium sillae TaxID=2810536 RepID=UPI00217D3DA5|nr:hypothetical protein [Brachybacterium sillae]MCS6711966.1 hypothetical protein [Brachybacterium sillae]
MYNLLIGLTRGEVGAGRLLEHTADDVREYLAPEVGQVRIERLLNLPTLLMPETGFDDEPQIARVGHVTNVNKSRYGYTFSFVPNPAIAPIPSPRIEAAAGVLDITDWEFHRTHWAVKDVDLYRVLDQELSARVKPKVFQFPTSQPFEPDLVAVMMPFSPAFSAVYESLKEGIEAAGMRCLRADNIWERDRILDDVLSLIWRARVVIADLSEKNPNVFYETGIAHTLGRDTILVAQSMSDIPFDLQGIRALKYLNNDEGRAALSRGITSRLNTITTS